MILDRFKLDGRVDLEPDEGSANPCHGPVPEGAGRRFTDILDFGPEPRARAPNTSYLSMNPNAADEAPIVSRANP